MMRIWHQSVTALDTLGDYGKALRRRIPELVAGDTEVVLHGVPAACYAGHAPAEILRYPYLRHRIHDRVLEQVRVAEGQGFDAVTFVTFAEPLLEQARSVLDIPVVSMLESSLLTACSLARRMALITLGDENVMRLREQVERHCLHDRIAGFYPLVPAVTEFDLARAFTRPDPVIDAFLSTARRAVAAGAGVVIPAEGVLNEVLAAAGVKAVEGAPVMDCVAVALAQTEMMVALRRRVGMAVGRRWDNARVPEALKRSFPDIFGPEPE